MKLTAIEGLMPNVTDEELEKLGAKITCDDEAIDLDTNIEGLL